MGREIIKCDSPTGNKIYKSARLFGGSTAQKVAGDFRVILDSFDDVLSQGSKVKLYCQAVAGAVVKAINDSGHAEASKIILNASDGESVNTRMEWVLMFMNYAKGSAFEWAEADAMEYLTRKERAQKNTTAKA